MTRQGGQRRGQEHGQATAEEVTESCSSTLQLLLRQYEPITVDGAWDDLRRQVAQLRAIIAANPDLHFLLAADGTVLAFEGRQRTDFYLPPQEFLGRRLQEVLPPGVARQFETVFSHIIRTRHPTSLEYSLPMPQGVLWYEARLLPIGEDQVVIVVQDITKRKKARDLRGIQQRVLEMILRGESQGRILSVLCQTMEVRLFPGARVSVLLVNSDRKTLTVGATANFPEALRAQWEGLPIAEGAGSCGTAAYRGRPVIVEDVATSPLWQDYGEMALRHGIRACWSLPFFARNGEVLGTFAVFPEEPRRPTRQDLKRMRVAVQLASITVEHTRVEQRLRQAATVFENTTEGVTITDERGDILAVNKAFTEITGYSEQEVIGQNQCILESHHHGKTFYDAMWASLKETGRWQGEIWNRRKNGDVYPEWRTISSVRDDNGEVVHYVSVFSDISAIKRSQEQFDYLAHHDPLTGLPNRLLLNARLTHALQHAYRSGHHLAVLFLDLDQFKNINDTLGHHVGDELLQAVARRLSHCVREEDTVARLGGDEFIVTLDDLARIEDATLRAQVILDAFAKPFELQGMEIFITTSIGISLYPDDGKTIHELVRNADTAMYRAKEQGRNHYEFYTRELTTSAVERFTLETSLRYALERGELVLYYQPQLSLDDGQLSGVEALVRWQHPELGLVPPSKFIPLAEEIGLISSIGDWVLRTACAQAKAWQEAGLPPIRMAVNVSGRQIIRNDLVGRVHRILQETGLEPRFLELEITESSIMSQAQRAISNLQALKTLGVTLAIDDFGTGYSSMSYLKRFCLDKIKIDKSFVQEIPLDPNDEAITRAIIAIGHNLQLKVIAEGVETQEQQDFLRDHGCNEMQGYLFSPPVTAEDLTRLLGVRAVRVEKKLLALG